MSKCLIKDIDPIETNDWIESINFVLKNQGYSRANFLVQKILNKLNITNNLITDYINSISLQDQINYPGDLEIERKIRSVVRWNAIMMVLRASKKNLDLGGHISSYQSISTIYEVCFNHFFKGYNNKNLGDLIYFQGHTSPGIYSRAFLEGRLNINQMDNFRQEIYNEGLSSYPHPRLMPNFWQFPTVSMGLSPINAIYQAKFLKYLFNRSIQDTSKQTVYAFLGDGEMDEPESKGLINIAAREKLDNLIFIINCNLQRLDGPVYGNGKIINELESIFNGSGWEVIKVIWGSKWDILFKNDINNHLIKLMNETLDGDYQRFRTKNGNYIRKEFFGKYKETLNLVKNMSDNEIWRLNRGGHDPKKIFSAIYNAKNIIDKPVVILMHTIKGYGLGKSGESLNISHQVKKIDYKELINFIDRFNLKNYITEKIEDLPYISFKKNSIEDSYIHDKRKKLLGYVPIRKNYINFLKLPKLNEFNLVLNEQKRKISTTIAFIRILNIILRNNYIKDYIVPIVADEARTFGIESLFKKIGIYNSNGQNYISEDHDKLLSYNENKNGQILQEGINESGAFSSWVAAGTSYSNNNLPMIPFYIYYSIFGFQRIGDLCWSAGDQQAKGFLIGATSGRSTLNGEGLQHADGHSHIYSLTIPSCISYDPAYGYELAVIIHNGLKKMYGKNPKNVYYYITITNENYYMPGISLNMRKGIIKGIYKFKTFKGKVSKIQLLGSGAILRQIIKAANILNKDFNINVDVYSVTSFTELARDGQNCNRWNLMNPEKSPKIPFIATIMNNSPAVAATDYIKLFAEQVTSFIPAEKYIVLGTDGFGRSDSRKNLRSYFEINYKYIVIAALYSLVKCNYINYNILNNAIINFKIDKNKLNPIFI